MSAGASPRGSHHEIAAGIARVEGYLLWHAEAEKARCEAERFADRMPWLTTGQREEVVRLHIEERLELSRCYLERIRDRCAELRGEYADRYTQLRLRLLWITAVAVALLALSAAALLTAALGD